MAGLCSCLLELSRASPRWPPPRTRSAGTDLRPEVHVCPLPFPGPSLWLRELLGARGDLVGESRELGLGAVARGPLSGSRAAWREAEGRAPGLGRQCGRPAPGRRVLPEFESLRCFLAPRPEYELGGACGDRRSDARVGLGTAPTYPGSVP